MRLIGAIITFNEENIIQDCIRGLKLLTEEIYILDSFSTDNTVKIAEENGCVVYQKEFNGYATQRNHLLSMIPEDVWIAMIDADEIISEDLALEVRTTVDKEKYNALLVRRQEYFLNKKMNFSYEKSIAMPRFFRVDKVRIEREINERYIFDGNTIILKNKLDHYSFNKGIESWIHKHNKYSTQEAFEVLSNNSLSDGTMRLKIKNYLYRSKLKLPILFVYYFLLKMPFLDGSKGVYYALLKFYYEVMISIKIKEKC